MSENSDHLVNPRNIESWRTGERASYNFKMARYEFVYVRGYIPDTWLNITIRLSISHGMHIDEHYLVKRWRNTENPFFLSDHRRHTIVKRAFERWHQVRKVRVVLGKKLTHRPLRFVIKYI